MKSKNRKSLEVLKNLLGEDLFQVTMETFAGERITFPKLYDCLDKESRNRDILSSYLSGQTVPDLKEKYNLSESQIYKIIEKTS